MQSHSVAKLKLQERVNLSRDKIPFNHAALELALKTLTPKYTHRWRQKRLEMLQLHVRDVSQRANREGL